MDKAKVKEILHILGLEFKEVGKKINLRCKICGDSKKSKIKKRGWILFDTEKITYYCFNCSASMSFKSFVKELNKEVHDKYFRKKDLHNFNISKVEAKVIIEQKKNISEVKDISDKIIPFSFLLTSRTLTSRTLKELQVKALKEVLRRKIPKIYYDKFLVCYDMYSKEFDYSNRLIIPFYDSNNIMYAFQGRSLYEGQIPKYKTYNNSNTKIFNFFNVDPNKIVIITEGPIDSLFVNNGIATSGKISYDSEVFNKIQQKFPNRIWAFDNYFIDETGKEKAIEFAGNGEKVFLWSKAWKDEKDFNELFIKEKVKNLTSEALTTIIYNNIGTGKTLAMKIKMR